MRPLQSKVTTMKAVVMAIVCFVVAGCVPGDRFYSSYINVSFPEMPKEQAVPFVLDAGFARGYKRGGRWEVGSLSLYDACGQVRDDWGACYSRFMGNAVWVEEREQRTDSTIRLRFSIVRPDGVILFEPAVKIEDVGTGSRAEFDFTEMAGTLSPEVKAEFYALKRLLAERYGSMVTTRGEP